MRGNGRAHCAVNITEPIRQHARTTPDAPAYLTDDRPPISYGDLDAMIDAVVARLLDAGVRPGQRAALALHRDLAFVIVALALARLGAAGFASNAPDEACDVRVASRGLGVSSHAPTILVDKPWFQVPARDARGATRALHPGGDALGHVFRTSGTTGRSKAVPMTHDAILRRAERRRRAVVLSQPARVLAKVRPSAAYGFQVMMRVILDAGAIVDAPPVERLGDAIERHQVTYLVTPPAVLSVFIASLRADEGPFRSLEVLEVSGSRLTEPLAALAARRVCSNVVSLYGSTEAGLIAVAPVRELVGVPGAVGRIVPDVVAEIVDEAGHPLPPDAEGTLRLRVNDVQSYLDDTDGSSSFRDGWFYPGDTGRITHEGLLAIVGRADERINVGGGKVAPEEVENSVLGIPGIVDAAAFAMPSRVSGIDRVALAIVTGPGFDFPTFQSRCGEALGVFTPETVLRMDAIPRNENGKVRRQELRKIAAAHAEASPR